MISRPRLMTNRGGDTPEKVGADETDRGWSNGF